MTPLDRLAAHFDACAARGAPQPVWWRDDDARRRGPRLAAVQETAAAAGAVIALAVIPDGVEANLLDWCATEGVAVLQHGVGHRNHQIAGKSAELGDARPVEAIMAELVAARQRLVSPAFLPVLVPPWNRMREDLAGPLAEAGYVGVSRFGKGVGAGPPRRVDTHIDPIEWRGARRLQPDATLDRMVMDAIAAGGPIGLLTHHRDHDAAITAFVADFAALVGAHPGARWVSPRTLFEAPDE